MMMRSSQFLQREIRRTGILSDQAETKYRMDVYNASAVKVGSYYFDVDYTDIFLKRMPW